MSHHQSFSSRHHFDTLFVILCVVVGITSHTISDTSRKPLINRTNDTYRKSFIQFLLDPNLTETLQSLKTFDKNIVKTQSNSKLIDAPLTKRSATVCTFLSNRLSGNQIRFCRRHHDVLESILPQVLQTTEKECKRITKDLKWNCSTMNFLFEKSSSLAYTREAALVRSILNASMMYLVAKVCSENNHKSCGCLPNNRQIQAIESGSLSSKTMELFLNEDYKVIGQENQSSRPSRNPRELSNSDLSKLKSGSPIHLAKSVEQRQGCIINSAFADAFTRIFIDSEDTRNLDKAYRILNGDLTSSHSPRSSNIGRMVDIDDKDLAHIKWTKSAINLHNNQIGRRIVREATQKRCRCHGLSGSCQLQTCWEQLLDLSIITSRLKSIYLYQSVKAGYKNLGTPEEPDLTVTKVFENEEQTSSPKPLFEQDGHRILQTSQIASEDLLYIYDSPEYCEAQPNLGHLGTKGRACIPLSNITIRYSNKAGRVESMEELHQGQLYTASEDEGRGICERLCCNRGHQRELVLDVVPCSCRFKFCCRVECENCLRQTDQYHCL